MGGRWPVWELTGTRNRDGNKGGKKRGKKRMEEIWGEEEKRGVISGIGKHRRLPCSPRESEILLARASAGLSFSLYLFLSLPSNLSKYRRDPLLRPFRRTIFSDRFRRSENVNTRVYYAFRITNEDYEDRFGWRNDRKKVYSRRLFEQSVIREAKVITWRLFAAINPSYVDQLEWSRWQEGGEF